MHRTRLLVALFTISVLFNACKKEDTQPQTQTIANVLTNGDFETAPYQDWTNNTGKNSTTNPTSYSVVYSSEVASSPSHSIKVTCSAATNDSTYQYMQQVRYTASTPIAAGAKLTMKVKIKTVNVQGNGISLAIGAITVPALSMHLLFIRLRKARPRSLERMISKSIP